MIMVLCDISYHLYNTKLRYVYTFVLFVLGNSNYRTSSIFFLLVKMTVGLVHVIAAACPNGKL